MMTTLQSVLPALHHSASSNVKAEKHITPTVVGFQQIAPLQATSSIHFGNASSVIRPETNILFELKKRAEENPHGVAFTQARGFYKDLTSAGMVTNLLLFENVLRTARVLKEKYGIKAGDKVATIDTNTPEFFMTMMGTMALGASVVPINILPLADRAGANEKLAHMIRVSKPKAIFIGNSVASDPDLSALTKIRHLQPLLKAHRKLYVKPLANLSLGLSKLMPGYFASTRKAKALFQNLTLMINSLPTDLKIVVPKDTANFNKMISGKPLDERDMVLTPDPKSTALILFTSGTTSMPKALPITHEALVHNVQALKDFSTEITPADKQLVILPQFHIFGLVSFLAMLSKGVQNVLVPSTADAARNPRELLNVIEREKITVIPCVPKIFERAFKQEGAASKLSGLRIIMSGGEKLTQDVYEKAKELVPGLAFWQGYGSTETLIMTVNKDRNDDGAQHVGEFISPDFQVELKDQTPDGKGEIWVKGPTIGKGYLDLSAEENGKNYKAGGWFNTGDLGQLENGKLKIVGRSKEIIKRAGEILSPEDFELRMKTSLLSSDGKKMAKDALCFSYTPPGTDKEKVMAIVLMEKEFLNETPESINEKLQAAVKSGAFAGRYVPDYILPITTSSFPEGFITAKKEYKTCRKYLNAQAEAGKLVFGPKGITIKQK
jgi:acyl-CoA synthetase (AMP-forming)/AMP-acid ligase II